MCQIACLRNRQRPQAVAGSLAATTNDPTPTMARSRPPWPTLQHQDRTTGAAVASLGRNPLQGAGNQLKPRQHGRRRAGGRLYRPRHPLHRAQRRGDLPAHGGVFLQTSTDAQATHASEALRYAAGSPPFALMALFTHAHPAPKIFATIAGSGNPGAVNVQYLAGDARRSFDPLPAPVRKSTSSTPPDLPRGLRASREMRVSGKYAKHLQTGSGPCPLRLNPQEEGFMRDGMQARKPVDLDQGRSFRGRLKGCE